MCDYFSNDELLESPIKRAAYSDRTSYLMAEMSRLAYFKFEGGSNLDEIITQLRSLLPDNNKLPALEAMIRAQVKTLSEAESKAILSEILDQSGFSLIETFSDPATGAQAFLCKRSSQDIAILAFRGTELNLRDIKADIKARLVPVEHKGKTVQIHGGYMNQFASLRKDIIAELARDEAKDLQLFITGHSLGGALAITAVKFLASDITGACYTFGSPPVGTKTFDSDIKTPIYRIVNHVDIVPRLPNPVLVFAIRLFATFIEIVLTPFSSLISQVKESKWFDGLSKGLIDAQKYRQSGYGSYLVGEGNDVRLKYSVSVYDRFIWWAKQFSNLFQGEFKLLSDHSIETYSKKLATWATQRK
ncbi:MAG TPA: lipase family protein [Gammaproteobacteria bacterium]|nr:lipase family protein [Gammaproteobacteria bacterium]